jgi:heme exporter protein A
MPQTTIYVSPRSIGRPDARPPAVVANGLARLFAGSPALLDVTLEIESGRLVALTGPNGAGKTTLLRVLATAIRPSFGSAAVDGLDVTRHPGLVRERTAFLSHAGGLYDDLTARENLEFAATMQQTPDAAARIERALDDVGLTPRASERVRGFSAGMRRRLALARILLGSPSLVLLDEPYAALDAEGMTLIDGLLDAWRDAGVSVLVASHAAERLEGRCDASVALESGIVRDVRGAGARVPTSAVESPAEPADGLERPLPSGAAQAR